MGNLCFWDWGKNTLSNILSSFHFSTLHCMKHYFQCPRPSQELKKMLDVNLKPLWTNTFMKCCTKVYFIKEWTSTLSHSYHRKHGGLRGKDLGKHQPAAAARHRDSWWHLPDFDFKTAIREEWAKCTTMYFTAMFNIGAWIKTLHASYTSALINM